MRSKVAQCKTEEWNLEFEIKMEFGFFVTEIVYEIIITIIIIAAALLLAELATRHIKGVRQRYSTY